MKVTIKPGTHGNKGFFYVSDAETKNQVATYCDAGNDGLQLKATYKRVFRKDGIEDNPRRYLCNKTFKTFEAMAKYKGWEL